MTKRASVAIVYPSAMGRKTAMHHNSNEIKPTDPDAIHCVIINKTGAEKAWLIMELGNYATVHETTPKLRRL